MKNIILALLLSASVGQAEWAPNTEADMNLDYSNSTFTVKADGSYVMEEERKFTAKNETGRNKMALEKVPYMPEVASVQILRASSITDGKEVFVNPATITERGAGGPASGVSGAKELIIPFTNLKIGSSIKYKLLTKMKAIHPGIFSMGFSYGFEFPELAGEVKIRSEKKLIYAVADKDSYLKITEGKDGKFYTLNIKMIKPATKALKDETLPILNHDTFSQVQVTTLENWNAFANILSAKYEKALAQELPPAFLAIVDKASKKSDVYDKIDVVTSELATIMTYAGNWTTADKMFYPRGHKEVASSKTGDCKDYATSTAGMLRKMGYKANVALVSRKTPYNPAMKIQSTPMKPGFAYPIFNHAIVRVEMPDNKVIWVDPTNPVSNSRVPGPDISASSALNLSAKATDVEVIPSPAPEDSVVKYEKKIRIMPDETAETEGTFSATGVFSTGILQAAIMGNQKDATETILRIFGSAAKEGVKADYSTRIASSFEAKIKTFAEKIYVEKDTKPYIVVPIPANLQLYFAGAGYNRVTDLYATPRGKIISTVKVEGYDFNHDESQGCYAVSPIADFERKMVKVEGGFEVRDVTVFKKDMISAEEMNDQEFKSILGDFRSCTASQAVEIKKIDPNLNLQQRLASYTLEEIAKVRNQSAAKAMGGSQKIRMMAEQLLLKDPTNVDLIVEVIRTTKTLGYRYGDIYGALYLQNADQMTDEALKTNPENPKLLMQKTYNLARMKKIDEAKKLFTKTYYATKDKDFDFYQLGAFMGEVMKDKKIEKQSNLKALEVAKTDIDKSTAYRSLGQIASAENNVKSAEEYYKYALQFDPKDTWLMNDMVILAMNAHEYLKAIEIGEKMLAIGDFGAGRRNVASSYGRLAGDIFKQKNRSTADKAQTYAMKGLKWDASSEECLTALGYVTSFLAQEGQDLSLAERAIGIWEKLAQVAEDGRTAQFASNNVALGQMIKKSIETNAAKAEAARVAGKPAPTPMTVPTAGPAPTAAAVAAPVTAAPVAAAVPATVAPASPSAAKVTPAPPAMAVVNTSAPNVARPVIPAAAPRTGGAVTGPPVKVTSIPGQGGAPAPAPTPSRSPASQ